jgi:hypothetical protein
MSLRWILPALSVAAAAVLLPACSEDAKTPDTAQQGAGSSKELPCDVAEYFQTRCLECHNTEPLYGAPMPLVTRDDLLAPAKTDPSKRVVDLVPIRLRDDADPMPEPGNSVPARPRATDAELAAIDAWIAAGTPARAAGVVCQGEGAGGSGSGGAAGNGGSGDAGAGGSAGGPAETCTPIPLMPEAKWEMPQATTDEYVCFGVDVPNAQKRHITQISPKVDNNKIVHHLLVFESKELLSGTPKKCGSTLDPAWKLLYAWGPGTQPYILPPEAGFPMGEDAEGEAGASSHYIVQVHYSNIPHDAGQIDGSGVELCATETLRPNDADLVALGGVEFSIPAHGTLQTECNTKVPGPSGADPMVVFQTWPHMHKIGTKLSSVVTHADGTKEDLVRVDNYSFDNQIVYPRYPNTMQLVYGDTIQTTCEWSNPSDKKVGWGEDTLDEMCFNFITYYPKRADFKWNGLAPSYFAQCKSTVK